MNDLKTVSTLGDLEGHLQTLIPDFQALSKVSEDEEDRLFDAVLEKFGADGLNVLGDHKLSVQLAAAHPGKLG